MFGGTRFIGLNLVLALAEYNVELTVVSRQVVAMPKCVRKYTMNREEFLAVENRVKYDLVVDFISYDEVSISATLNSIKFKRYLLISSAWLPWLWGGDEASDFNDHFSPDKSNLNPDTKRYLMGKWHAEMAALKFCQKGKQVVIIRLPPVLGRGDHTGRTSFYSERVHDDWPMLVPENLDTDVQFINVETLTPTLADWILSFNFEPPIIWNAVPNMQLSYYDFLDNLFKRSGRVGVNLETIREDDVFYKKYMDSEPLIGAPCFAPGNENIFEFSNKKVAPFLALSEPYPTSLSSSRKMEIEYLRQKKLAT